MHAMCCVMKRRVSIKFLLPHTNLSYLSHRKMFICNICTCERGLKFACQLGLWCSNITPVQHTGGPNPSESIAVDLECWSAL